MWKIVYEVLERVHLSYLSLSFLYLIWYLLWQFCRWKEAWRWIIVCFCWLELSKNWQCASLKTKRTRGEENSTQTFLRLNQFTQSKSTFTVVVQQQRLQTIFGVEWLEISRKRTKVGEDLSNNYKALNVWNFWSLHITFEVESGHTLNWQNFHNSGFSSRFQTHFTHLHKCVNLSYNYYHIIIASK